MTLTNERLETINRSISGEISVEVIDLMDDKNNAVGTEVRIGIKEDKL